MSDPGTPGPDGAEKSWYFNVDKRQTEQGPSERGFSETRLGPFATEAEAASALDALHRRNATLDEDDRAWRDGA